MTVSIKVVSFESLGLVLCMRKQFYERGPTEFTLWPKRFTAQTQAKNKALLPQTQVESEIRIPPQGWRGTRKSKVSRDGEKPREGGFVDAWEAVWQCGQHPTKRPQER